MPPNLENRSEAPLRRRLKFDEEIVKATTQIALIDRKIIPGEFCIGKIRAGRARDVLVPN